MPAYLHTHIDTYMNAYILELYRSWTNYLSSHRSLYAAICSLPGNPASGRCSEATAMSTEASPWGTTSGIMLGFRDTVVQRDDSLPRPEHLGGERMPPSW